VLATLACGIYTGRRSSQFYSLHARIEASAVWRTLDFVLNGVVFLVLGLQLPAILSGIRTSSKGELVIAGALFSGIVILLRMLWVFPGAWLSSLVQHRLLRGNPQTFSPRSVFLVGWAGMRGVLALAAALSLPEKLNNGTPFPERNTILYLTFCVIFVTLVLQGLSMPTLIRHLGLASGPASCEEEASTRRQMISAALQTLRQIREQGGEEQCQVYDQMEDYYRRRLIVLESDSPAEREHAAQQVEHFRLVAQQLRDVERAVALRLRDENKIHDHVLRTLEDELDLLDARDLIEKG
jgi:NhaP-type Na+/H+ or K+/H+ antiporter